MHDTGTLCDYNPDGSREWSFQFPFPSGTLLGLTTGPDANIYIFHSYVNLWSLTPTGKKRWQVDGIAGSTFPVMPTVSPDGSVLVFPTVYSFGVNGKVVAVMPRMVRCFGPCRSRVLRPALRARSRSAMMARRSMCR
ncbi:MAG: PQQ-like beta-propeller repeat protein [Blastocatellia bacterium]|nr:PQQ-like beta-propeller repeat protein [Blastocatellia bacterium]